jgi:hypothetical protein
MSAIKIYNIPVVVELTLLDNGVRNNNMPFRDSSDFNVYRGSHNPIEFIVRNSDRRPVDLTNKTLTITIIDFHTSIVVEQKLVEIVEAVKGRVRFTFDPIYTSNWAAGIYKYTILLTNADTTTNLLAVDADNNAAGFFEFVDGVLPQLTDSEKILGSAFAPINVSPPTSEPTIYVSSGLSGDASFGNNDGLHTAVVYVTNYAGKFWIEGTLEDSPTALDKDWFTIHLSTFYPYHEFGNTPDPDDVFSGIDAFNFTGSVKFVRFRHQPDDDNAGTFDQVLFRA